MDIEKWIFLGLAVASGVASVVKSAQKKNAAQTSQRNEPSPNKPVAEDWLKNILRETTQSLKEIEDDYIPKNTPQPKVNPIPTPPKGKVTLNPLSVENRPSPELYRRKIVTAESNKRNAVSLENVSVVEGNVKHDGLHAAINKPEIVTVTAPALLNPRDELVALDDVRKALIYGEILRTKF